MASYSIHAKVDQIVTKDILLLVEADSEEKAKEFAKEALEVYPGPAPHNPMIHRIITKVVHHWIPRSIDFVEVKEENEAA